MGTPELDPAAVIGAVEDKVGWGKGAWDMVDPGALVAAFREVLAPRSEADEHLIQAALAHERDSAGASAIATLRESYVLLCEAAAEVRRLREPS